VCTQVSSGPVTVNPSTPATTGSFSAADWLPVLSFTLVAAGRRTLETRPVAAVVVLGGVVRVIGGTVSS